MTTDDLEAFVFCCYMFNAAVPSISISGYVLSVL